MDRIYTIFRQGARVTIDSRQVRKGDLFFALRGENLDGNAYAAQALEAGAALAICDNLSLAPDHPACLVVEDSLKALQDLAVRYREDLTIPVLGITGSNGKTTTKELVTQVLSQKYRVTATQGNLNNHIGVPLTLLSIPSDAEIAIVEMGANHPGEIRELCSLARPTAGLITNIGKAHLGGFGGFGGVVQAKSELYASLRGNMGTVFVHAGDPLLMRLSEGMRRELYGPGTQIDARLAGAGLTLSMEFLGNGAESGHIDTQLSGSYNLPNLLAAAAIGRHFDVPWALIAHALSSYAPKNNRSEIRKSASNTLILDAYNANPSSMEASLLHFSALGGDHKWAILGDMLELGEEAEDEHRRILELALSMELERLVLVGPVFSRVADARDAVFADTRSCRAWLKEHAPSEALVLLKGSRGIHLEDLLDLM
ncbi:MAG TPA: UDP-N-acetylmuramoyl-tripeptide--D-alanyl-D-alanine ligase [Bacteroidales bacterium]|nr:UDP-N-acetylmuramoyl-tripeptide--D-alanyl-D-alanine ligase [Bacteroidales bacterium]